MIYGLVFGIIGFIIIASIFLFLFFFARYSLLNITSSGRRIYKIDISNFKIRENENLNLRFKKFLFLIKKNREWDNLQNVLNFLEYTKGYDFFQQAILKMQKYEENFEFEFQSKFPLLRFLKKYEFYVKLVFNKTIENQYLATVKWKRIDEKFESWNKTKQNKIELVHKDKLIQIKSKYISFVAFNIKKNKDSANKLLKWISQIWNKEIMAFISSGMLIIILFGRNKKILEKEVKNFRKLFLNQIFDLGAKQFYNGSAITISKNNSENKDFQLTLRKLEFFISKSINEKIELFSIEEKHLDNYEYEQFSNGLLIFKNILKNSDFQISNLPIKKYENNRKIINYSIPVIKEISNHILSDILNNMNNKRELIDAYATKISQSNIEEPILVDVTETWLFNNFDQIKNKNIVHIVEFEDRVDLNVLIEKINLFSKKGYLFGVRIIQFEEKIHNILKLIMPKFIVIDKTIVNENILLDSNTYTNILSITEFSKINDVKIIFEKPSDSIDATTAKKINLNFYY